MRYYIADPHFYHKNLIARMDRRPFKNVEDMNSHMVRQWNRRVRQNDEVVVIGDLSFGNGMQTNEILEQLRGRIYLIEGNHDHRFLKDRLFDMGRLQWVKPYHELNDSHRKVILSHYPIICYNGQYRKNEDGNPAAYMLYGHVHNTMDQKLVDSFVRQTRGTLTTPARKEAPEPIQCNLINCFCMYSDYTPLTLDEWIQLNERRMANNTSNIG